MSKLDYFVLIIILLIVWLTTATAAISVGSIKKDLKDQRADIEELFLRSEKLFERSNANNR
jgi:predicted Holliday junction resolvase-like endonuclease